MMSNAEDFHDKWKNFLTETKSNSESLSEIDAVGAIGRALDKFGQGTRPPSRLKGMRSPGPLQKKSKAKKIKQIAQKNQLPAVRQKGELTAPEREKVIGALVRVAKQNLVPLERDLIKPEDDIVDVILSVMERLCVVQKMDPIKWQNLASEARIKMEPMKQQNPDELIKYFETVAKAIKEQGGVDANCDQIATKNQKQIQYSV